MLDDVQLRKVVTRDLPIFFEQQRDPEATRMAAFPARRRQAFWEHWGSVLRDSSNITRTVVYRGEVAGNMLCWEHLGEHKIGYWLGRDYWGKGIASTALAQFLHEVPHRPLFASVAKHNVASLRVLSKCGFSIVGEGTFPGADRKPCEEYLLSLVVPAECS